MNATNSKRPMPNSDYLIELTAERIEKHYFPQYIRGMHTSVDITPTELMDEPKGMNILLAGVDKTKFRVYR